jgi:hypothetical protein
MCVQSTFWKKSDGRIVVHLWNGINTTSDHGQQDAEVPLREESIPIHGIRIIVHRGSVDRARIEPQGIALPIQHQEGMTILELPPIEVHSAVVLEIQEAP